VDLYRKVRLAYAEGMSQREAARHFNISRDSVAKMMAYSVPSGYRRTAPVKRPKLDAFTGIIDGWLDGDREVHRKQRHTAKRVFERLRDEHGFTGGYTIVKDYMRQRERRGREMFMPLAHAPGRYCQQVDNTPEIMNGVRASGRFRPGAHRLAPAGWAASKRPIRRAPMRTSPPQQTRSSSPRPCAGYGGSAAATGPPRPRRGRW